MGRADSGAIARAALETGRAAGFTACGIAPCAPSEHAGRLDAWLARGHHGSMAWMERTAGIRKDLRSRWDWARSALVGALAYECEPRPREALPGIARYVSRYARGRDYHDVVGERLRRWASGLESAIGRPLRHATLVDTSAVLERELAVQAGLGWIGKNTCLIGPGGDSWRFLGVLLTDLELPTGAQRAAERCGSCRACLDACPTDAFPEPWVLDARRCISYLTIEHRGPIPNDMKPGIGDWLFGCDVCQEVCPWNRRVEVSVEPAFNSSEVLSRITLAGLARMTDGEFRAAFRGTPLSRPKRAGMIRNALIVGANVRDDELLGVARELVADPDPIVAGAARDAIDRARRGG